VQIKQTESEWMEESSQVYRAAGNVILERDEEETRASKSKGASAVVHFRASKRENVRKRSRDGCEIEKQHIVMIEREHKDRWA